MSTIARALALLDHFSPDHPRLGLTEMMRLSGRDKATVHRHLTALVQAGYLEQAPDTRAYRLGPALTRLADMRRHTVPEIEMVGALIDDLSRVVGELVHVNRLHGFDLIHLCHAEHHNHPVRVSFDATERPPVLATASGRAFLAFSAPEVVAAALADPGTWDRKDAAPDGVAVRETLATIAAHGFAYNRDTLRLGVSSVAIPVFDADGTPVATCSIAYPTGRGGADFRDRLARHLMAFAPKMTVAMGGVVPARVQKIWAAQGNSTKMADQA
ncbi:IclR family transcriptional regulator [uncultured Tateyamaria sp.]|uniref:IclR family transcriptional regulator n=1 Tax=uncultured Tateyamaria sp. TaxID=455651 RepID=UPI0026252BA0|nr:IclR family transcriptional regulator [uncultured Tateyamaria sp.]